MLTTEPPAPPLDQEVPSGGGGMASLAGIEYRLTPSFTRDEPRPRAMAYPQGLLNPTEPKNSW